MFSRPWRRLLPMSSTSQWIASPFGRATPRRLPTKVTLPGASQFNSAASPCGRPAPTCARYSLIRQRRSLVARPVNCLSATAAFFATGHRPGRTIGLFPAQLISTSRRPVAANAKASPTSEISGPVPPAWTCPERSSAKAPSFTTCTSTAWCTHVSSASRTAVPQLVQLMRVPYAARPRGPSNSCAMATLLQLSATMKPRSKPPVPPLSIM